MTDPIKVLEQKALEVLCAATRDEGILALPSEDTVDNYTRIWSRDSVMAGLVGLDYNNAVLVQGLKNSLNTLKDHQSQVGIIPSNVSIGTTPKASYGGTAGRVDATLWYIIGALQYLAYSKDDDFRRSHIWHIEKALQVCTIWEYNNKHLIYTPLSGNWADEYPIHGYTLYDNCLRLWGLELYAQIINKDESISTKIHAIRESIRANFRISKANDADKYHQLLFSRAVLDGEQPYFAAGFNPSRYYTMFDAAGNGLALFLGLTNDKDIPDLTAYLDSVFREIEIDLMPAFWPIISESDPLYYDLISNYAYAFKNHPHHFHNGGIWPIMNGWLAKGLNKYGANDVVNKMKEAYLNYAQKENYKFSEYIASNSLEAGGQTPLCYSASGALMLINP